ncbi:unnamed protein product [Rotaria sp. Silwood1]|nr:unnamed protein product [Rotaria sp. Silwood1]CAF1535884.1 unnamed protein product [Rotaria sp. Silwood1]CAF3683016.1 unnamed protein product [Rotaria sp. Silwood1]CAF3708384.1 unnamed protein product [Rotaria sp. Silwood1]CAF3730400.1 unnamed protein product [Rotaria sp. Silwood1]
MTSITPMSSTTRSMPQREQMLIDAFNSYIQIGIGSLLFLFGVTFNCLSLLYFHVSRSFRHTTFRLYFSIISILDTIRLFEFLIFILFDKGYLKVTLNLCRSIFFTIMFTGQASIWLTVGLAVEKCIIIWFPIKGRLFFTMCISKFFLILTLLIVFFADVIYLLPSFFLHAYENLSIHTFMCVWQSDNQSSIHAHDQWKKHYFTFNTVFFHSIIPSILLLTLNWLILCSLSRQRIILTKIGSIDAKNILKREKQFKEKTIQLVLSSFFVIITISPRYILTMVNAFATNIKKTPIMPLYIYVNLNTVFRVLEMCNYSLNIIIAIMSGRTSRLEIRKLLWESLFWRFKRTQSDHHELKFIKHSFSVDDDDDDDNREHTTKGHTNKSYCSLTHHNHIISKISSGNNSKQKFRTSKASSSSSYFTCCGFTIDLSHKQTYSSNSRISPPHSSINKNSNRLLTKTHSYPQTSLIKNDRKFKQQQQQRSISCRTTNKSRTTTPIHCLYNTSSSKIITRTNNSLNPRIQSKENQNINFEKLSPIIDKPFIKRDESKTNINLLTESPTIIQTDFNEPLPPAYIIETC